jgi:hypothetical protein
LPLLRSAVDAHLSMATFATAGIVGRAGNEASPRDDEREDASTLGGRPERAPWPPR